MQKIVIATHERLAEGYYRTLNYLIPEMPEIIILSAYIETNSIQEQVDDIYQNLKDEDKLIVLTDIAAGSVNQGFCRYISRPNTLIVSGINLPLVMSIILEAMHTELDLPKIRTLVSEAQDQLLVVNDVLRNFEIETDE
ncbi:PTS fructose transporter subunit IIA [Streptococcus suis]|nr:PTS fructose transporter subunit IIA [Streptococcus suis]